MEINKQIEVIKFTLNNQTLTLTIDYSHNTPTYSIMGKTFKDISLVYTDGDLTDLKDTVTLLKKIIEVIYEK